MRRSLEALYKGSGLLAGFFLVWVAILSLTQIVGRMLGYAAHSFDEFAGYCMAASSFLGLAWTFRCNEHIRVTLAIGRARGALRRAIEIFCLLVAALLIGFFAWHIVSMTLTSYELNDVSQGLMPVRLWIPQSALAVGLVIMLIALLDDLFTALGGGAPSYDAVADSGAAPTFER